MNASQNRKEEKMKTTKSAFQKWFETFMEEKQLDSKVYEVEHNGDLHMIETEKVAELILKALPAEQAQIKNTIVKIDFMNGNVHHFFNHLAMAYVKTNF